MPTPSKKIFSASEQALGYIFQLRYALLQMLRLPEDTSCFIEKDDDIDFSDPEEGKILASLKHKAPGDTLSDLSPDFWKSVRIWLTYYIDNEVSTEQVSFFLFTTGTISSGSLLEIFLPEKRLANNSIDQISQVLNSSSSKTIGKTKDLLNKLPNDKWLDFFERITIFDSQLRIQDIKSAIIQERFRPIRVQFRIPIYERLEGWWFETCIELLSHDRCNAINGWEISDKLSSISEQFREDNLPIDFEHANPGNSINPEHDDRYFVMQLKAIGIGRDRLIRAILDYYRAFEQRSSWIRERVSLSGELEKYDDRLIEEWARLKEIIFDEIAEDSTAEFLQKLGKDLLLQLSTTNNPNLRIRQNVCASFVAIGSYHMLANDDPARIYWHPNYQEVIDRLILEGTP